MLIAVDPGASGGFAWTDPEGRIVVDTMPETMGEIFDYIDNIFYNFRNETKAVIEDVGGFRPGNSGPTRVKFARHIGHLEMALYACGISTERVAPQTWMRGIGVPTKLSKTDRKNWIKDHVQRLYPQLKVTLKTADSLGILTWALKK